MSDLKWIVVRQIELKKYLSSNGIYTGIVNSFDTIHTEQFIYSSEVDAQLKVKEEEE